MYMTVYIRAGKNILIIQVLVFSIHVHVASHLDIILACKYPGLHIHTVFLSCCCCCEEHEVGPVVLTRKPTGLVWVHFHAPANAEEKGKTL